MEFGVFNSVYAPVPLAGADGINGVERDRIADEVEFVKAADRSGFKYTWATEHHFLTEYSHLSANEVFLGYLAGVTERIHIGSGIFNITPPVNHPARTAERVAMLDHLSRGRFEFGMGRGSSTTEQGGFGIHDPDLTKEMFDEVVGQFKLMWRDGEYGYDGRFFSMPARNVLPKPYSDPHPPMWVAAGNPGTFEKAARMGLGVLCFSSVGPEALKPLIEIYKTNIEHAEPVGEYVNNNVMVTTSMLCLEDADRAIDAAAAMHQGYHETLLYKFLDTFPRPAHVPDVVPDHTRDEIRMGAELGLVPFGDPEMCARSIERYAQTGADQLVFGMLSSDMPIDICIEAVETFGTHVIPMFDKDPVHSTTRQREQWRAARV